MLVVTKPLTGRFCLRNPGVQVLDPSRTDLTDYNGQYAYMQAIRLVKARTVQRPHSHTPSRLVEIDKSRLDKTHEKIRDRMKGSFDKDGWFEEQRIVENKSSAC